MDKPEPIKLNVNSVITFKDSTPRYGRAEFDFCFQLQRGKLKRVFIMRRQQPAEEVQEYVLPVDYTPLDWSISSWQHEGVELPAIWRGAWCRYHKAFYWAVYVPLGTNQLRIMEASNLRFNFERLGG